MDSYLKGAQNAMYSLVDGASLQLEVKSRSLIKTKVCSLWETLFNFPIISFWFEVHFGYSANRIFTLSGNENTKLAHF